VQHTSNKCGDVKQQDSPQLVGGLEPHIKGSVNLQGCGWHLTPSPGDGPHPVVRNPLPSPHPHYGRGIWRSALGQQRPPHNRATGAGGVGRAEQTCLGRVRRP